MNWDAQKRACDKNAREDAEAGVQGRDKWTTRGLQERYDKKWREVREQIEATQAHEAALEPLRQIEREADALTYSDNEEVRNLANALKDLTNYLIEKESN